MQTIGRNISAIRVQIVNSGGLAKRVRFAVVQDNQVAYGHPHPTPTFQPGESRIIETALTPASGREVAAYIACWDTADQRFYFWPRGGSVNASFPKCSAAPPVLRRARFLPAQVRPECAPVSLSTRDNRRKTCVLTRRTP